MRNALVAAVLLLAASSAARAEILPEWPVDHLCDAADVIVEGRALEGDQVEILRVHKGADRLPERARRIEVRSLRLLDRNTWPQGFVGDGEARPLGTSTAAFFLKALESGGWEPVSTIVWKRGEGEPDIAGACGVIWFDETGCWTYRQMINPGRYTLQAADEDRSQDADAPPRTATALRRQIAAGLAGGAEWRRCLALEDPTERAAALARWLDPAKSPDGRRRTRLFQVRGAMAAIGAPAVPVLVRALDSADPEGEGLREGILSLYDIGRPARAALPTLIRLAHAERDEIRTYAVETLGQVADIRGAPTARGLLDDERPWVVEAAATALASMEDRGAFELIRAKLPAEAKADRAQRVAALIHALHRLDAKRARPVVEEYLAMPAMRAAHQWLRGMRDEE